MLKYKLDSFEKISINLATSFPNIFGYCTFAHLTIYGSYVIFDLDSSHLDKDFMQTGTLFILPDELKPYLPKEMVFSTFSDSTGKTMIVWLNPSYKKIGSYSHQSGNTYENRAYYGQMCWII